jgi:uncharacterized cupredoxin-like copper-binding protein|tara:strand:+ start:1556 stop:2053 length:498 start_codon:yes stop_codon:yes gene_type:complete
MKKLILIFIFIPNILFAGSMKAIGAKGNEENVDRVIKVTMYDNYYQPNSFKVNKNETIKFEVENKGELVHEFNIATKEMHLKHQPEMMMMVEHEILLADKIDKKKMMEMSKKNPAMAHSHSNSVLLSPGEKAELIWKFSNTVDIEAACNVPGHYDVGMIAKINNI